LRLFFYQPTFRPHIQVSFFIAVTQERNEGDTIPRAPNHYGAPNDCEGHRKVPTMSHHNYFLQYSTFASVKLQVWTWGRQTLFLTRAPSHLVMPLQILTNIFLPEMQQYGLTYPFL